MKRPSLTTAYSLQFTKYPIIGDKNSECCQAANDNGERVVYDRLSIWVLWSGIIFIDCILWIGIWYLLSMGWQ